MLKNTLISELMDLPCTFIVNHTYITVPSLALIVDKIALEYLENSDKVLFIQDDTPQPVME